MLRRALVVVVTLAWVVPAAAQEGTAPLEEPAAAGAAPAGEETPWYRRSAPAASEEAPRTDEGGAPEGAAPREAAGDDEARAVGEEGAEEEEGAAGGDGEEEEEGPHGDFYFGSYGRVIAASDLEGREGRQNVLTAWGPRVDEADTYFELELRREDHFAGMDTSIVATLAYLGPLFHYDGDLSERIAVRNLFVRVQHLLTPGLSVWAGSRMWRGDDVYLLNFWPLDNLNLVGGGLSYAIEDVAEVSFAGGLAQPDDPFQRQEVLVPARAGFTPERVLLLDRPRLVVAGRLTWWLLGRRARDGLKTVLYGEGHYLPAGERQDAEGALESLPDDAGWVLGAQVGGYLSDRHTFVNLFLRYARGLGAYDPLGVPFREGSVIQTGRAEELRVALSASWEVDAFALQLGAYYRYFRDADPNVFGRGTVTEGVVDARPIVWFGRFLGLAVDVSYSGVAVAAINEVTGAPEGGNLFKLGVVPFISPFGRGAYTRPHIRLIYSLTVRDDDARALYPALDPRSARNVEHFLGVGVEWWFSSSSYGS